MQRRVVLSVVVIVSAVCAPWRVLATDPVATSIAATNVDGNGVALSEFWRASPAEYQASAEQILDLVGAADLRKGSLAGNAMADFLRMFGGGAGAPQDLVKRQPIPKSGDEL